MKNKELAENWKKYALKFKEGGRVLPLKKMFKSSWGEYQGGVLFDKGGPKGTIGAIFKPDKNGNCYQRVKSERRNGDKWVLVGKFAKLAVKKKKKKANKKCVW